MLQKYFQKSAEAKLTFIQENKNKLEKAITIIVSSIRGGGKILICGNGGSAADAQHFAGEIIGRFKLKRQALPAIALTTNSSVLTAVANDYDFANIFSRQIEGLGQKHDILVVISTSGNSQNIIQAIKQAKKMGIYSIGLLGKAGGEAKKIVNLALIVNSFDTPRIQECHLTIYHVICEEMEKRIINDN